VIEGIEGMPTATVGLRGSGKLSRDDYREVLESVLNEAIETGRSGWSFS
jgi:hypothetical protein